MKKMYEMLLWYMHIIAESLPISSSGHYSLASKIYKLKDLSDSDKYLMHIPSAIAIIIFLILHINVALNIGIFKLALYIFIANSFTGIFYFLFKKFKPNFPLALGFLITGSLLLFSEHIKIGNQELTYISSSLIGIVQGIALLPGISRLAITYITGIYLGLSPIISLYFSLSTELALILASLLLVKNKKQININLRNSFLIPLTIVISYLLLELILWLAKYNLIYLFGYYMIIPIALCMVYGVSGKALA